MANFNLNEVRIAGRLVADPEIRTTQAGVAVANIRVAVTSDFPDKEGKRNTDFFDVVVWRQGAELLGKYFHKGSSIYVRGSLQNRSWDDKDGQKRYRTEIQAEEIKFVDGKNEGSNGNYEAPATNNAAPIDSAPAKKDNAKPTYAPAAPKFEDYEGDLPF